MIIALRLLHNVNPEAHVSNLDVDVALAGTLLLEWVSHVLAHNGQLTVCDPIAHLRVFALW